MPGRLAPCRSSARSASIRPAGATARAEDPAPGAISVGDALLRPFDFPFEEPTTLTDVQKYLAKALGAPVVLDLAALDRLDVDPEDTVQLDLKAVRLKTGLKLLLDQVGMTYRVVAEDNLLILTDAVEAGEPIDRALRELKALHLEMHDLRDAIDDLRDLVEEDLGIEPARRPERRLPSSASGPAAAAWPRPPAPPPGPARPAARGPGMRAATDSAPGRPPAPEASRTAPPAPGRRVVPRLVGLPADPRSAVLFFLASAFLIGGGRKGLQAIRARRVVAAIAGSNPDPADVEAAGDHGRAGLIDLFRLLGTAERPPRSATPPAAPWPASGGPTS